VSAEYPEDATDSETDDEVSLDGPSPAPDPGLVQDRLFQNLAPGVRLSQARQFRAGVELDDRRPDGRHWGLRTWFQLWCSHARPGWLDPLGGPWGLMRLEDNLRRFQGDQGSLKPLLELLEELTAQGVSPSAFLRYAVLARIQTDYDWRSWERLHGGALAVLARTVVRLRGKPPFNKPLGGSRRINPEVVLVKYSLRPLARLPQMQLEDHVLMDAYVAAWKKTRLDHPMAVFFFRRNVFPFLYAQSGRIDLVQLTALLESLPPIEDAFRMRYPEVHYDGAFQTQADRILIYGTDVDDALARRRRQGMSDFALIQELRLYLRILARLLTQESAIFLAGFMAQVIQDAAGTDLGSGLERLLDLIGAAEGIQVYEWHVRRLRDLPEGQREAYLELLRLHGGIDPEYRRAEDIFRDPAEGFGDQDSLEAALGLAPTPSGRRSAQNIVDDYVDLHPPLREEYETWRQEIFDGKDRSWGPQKFPGLDSAGPALHRALVRATLKGVGGPSSRFKSESYRELWEKFGKATAPPSFEARQTLVLDELQPPKPSGDPEIRKVLKLDFLASHWLRLQGPGLAPDAAAPAFLRQSLEFREASSSLLTRSQDPELTPQERSKLHEQSELVRAKAENLERVMEVFPRLAPELQRLTALIVGAHALGNPEAMTGILLGPYQLHPLYRDRLRFLQADLRIEIITLDQLGWLVNLWETVAELVRNDSGLHKALRSRGQVEDLISPYLLTKRKELSWDALDAAVKTISQLNRLKGERSKWQTLWERSARSTSQSKNYLLAASKAPLDCYYGDMGGTCLSLYPKMILHPGFHVLRLFDGESKQIVGEAVLFLNRKPVQSYDPSRPVWFLFAINPLPSIMKTLGTGQQLEVYLGFRSLALRISRSMRLPLLLPGLYQWGILSNDGQFMRMICDYEIHQGSRPVHDALGFSLYYEESCYAKALVIDDGVKPEFV